MICPNCGFDVRDGSRFCTQCGAPLPVQGAGQSIGYGGGQGAGYGGQSAGYGGGQGPGYSGGQGAGYGGQGAGYSNRPYTQDMEMEELRRVFIDKNVAYYENAFRIIESGRSKWNWPGVLVPVCWLAYRKMYSLVAAYIGILIVAEILVAMFVASGDGGSVQALTGIVAIIEIILRIAVGLKGNTFYKNHVDKKLAEAQTMMPDSRRFYAAKKGGTSVLAVVITIIVYGIINGLVSM